MKVHQNMERKESWRDDFLRWTGQVTGQVTGEVSKLVLACQHEMRRRELREALSLKSDANFRRLYLLPALEASLLAMTIPENPNSRLQRYRLTENGNALAAALGEASTGAILPPTGEVTGQVTGQVTGEVTGEVSKLVLACQHEMSRRELQDALSLKSIGNFRRLYLLPALDAALIEMTIPEMPNSRLQRYRLTGKGDALSIALRTGKTQP